MKPFRCFAFPSILAGCAIGVALTDLGMVANAQDVQQDFKRFSEAARTARNARKFEDVESNRVERLKALRAAAADNANKPTNDPILEAYRVLELVDGAGDDPGLVNKLAYDEAARILLDAWQAMCAAFPEGPVLGEVATRLFEVVHQKKAVWSETAANKVAAAKPPVADSILLQVLQKAEKLDPCCVAAVPMVEWLKPLNPEESFLRAEVRPSFKARQDRLLAVSHPLLRGLAGSAQPQPKPAEGLGAAVLPWHAPTEYLKAQSLQMLLDETETLEDVLQNWYSVYESGGRKIIRYIIPRKPLKGRDASGNRFELLYGRLLITSIVDKEGRRRPAAMLLNKKGEWEQRVVDLLWREPTDEEVKANKQLKEVHELVMRLEVLEEWSVSGKQFRLLAYPIQDTELLLRSDAKLLCLKNSHALPKIRFKHADNDPRAFIDLLDNRPGEFSTDPQVWARIKSMKAESDKTQHPLVALAKTTNLFVVLSRFSKSDSGPAFFREQKEPFLRLQDGGKLFFKLTGDGSPCCFRDTEYGRLVYPLSDAGVPSAVVFGSGAGKCMMHILQEAGFSPSDAATAIRRWLANENEIPDNYRKYVEAKAEAKKAQEAKAAAGAQQQKARAVTQADIYAASAALVDNARETQLGLRAPELAKHIPILLELRQNYYLFGYRHFTDKRGNIFFSARLRDSCPILWPDGGYEPVDAGAKSRDNRSHAFAVVQPDGRPIAIDQVYSFEDYQKINDNKRDEYLTEALLYAPSFGTFNTLLEDSLHPFVHPDDKNPLQESKPQPTGNAASSNSKSSAAFDAVELQCPVPAWQLSEDPKQAQTLTNLHNAYVELVRNAAGNLHAAAQSRERRFVDGRLEEEWRWWDNDFTQKNKDAESLLAIQLASARRYARQKYHHRAIVYYNDLLERMPAANLSKPYKPLLENVPDTAMGQACVNDLKKQIQELNRLITLQVELAGVLLSAKQPESAHAIFSRVVDDFDFFAIPSFDIMRRLLASYGLQMEQDADNALAGLRKVADLSRRAIKTFDLKIAWRDIASKQPAVAGDRLQRTTRMIALLDQSTGGSSSVRNRLSKEESRELEELRRQDREDNSLTFGEWLERKKFILGDNPPGDRWELACRMAPEADYDLRNCCPLTFSKNLRFIEQREAITKFLVSCRADLVADWCKAPLDNANADPLAVPHSFLLAWYWADRGDNPKARTALINLASLCRDLAKANPDQSKTESMVHSLNMFRALACSSCLSHPVPGVRSARVDFTDALSLQVLMWEREWLAAGLPPYEATKEADEVEAAISDARVLSTRTTLETAEKRYFFPDYTCRFGGVPDYVVREVLERPDLFKEIKATEVGSDQEAEAVRDELEWSQVSKKESLDYFGRLPSRVHVDEIDEEIVGVR